MDLCKAQLSTLVVQMDIQVFMRPHRASAFVLSSLLEVHNAQLPIPGAQEVAALPESQ